MELGSSAGDSDLGDVLADDSELSLESPGSGGTGNLELSADTGLGSGDLDLSLDSELALSDDDDMVLSGSSGAGSDLSLGAGDSGINLSSPTDSGLSLEVDSGIQLDSPGQFFVAACECRFTPSGDAFIPDSPSCQPAGHTSPCF